MFETGEGFDWGTGENMAFGSLLLKGNPIRLSGQDVRREHLFPSSCAVIEAKKVMKPWICWTSYGRGTSDGRNCELAPLEICGARL